MTANTAHSELTSADAAALAATAAWHIEYDAPRIRADKSVTLPMVRLLEMIERQQRLIDYALTEIASLRAANDAREGDGK